MNATPADIEKSLNVIKDNMKDVLESDAPSILAETVSRTKWCAQRIASAQSSGQTTTVQVEIVDRPLTFQSVKCNDYRMHADILWRITWKTDTKKQLAATQDLVLRLWSDDERLIFRSDFDAVELLDKWGQVPKRVLMRCHFDIANTQQDGPGHHLQFGGNPRDEEWVWHPKEIDLPRFMHQPMDLVLLCEFVIANFFVSKRNQIIGDAAVKGVIHASEQRYLKPYYEACLQQLQYNQKSTLLGHLWNKPW